MASISYTLYDYANAPADLLDTFTVQAFSDVTLLFPPMAPSPMNGC